MIQRGEELHFAFESRDALRVADEGLGQDLDRDLARKLRVARAIDFAHAAGAERRENLVGAEATAGLKRHVESSRIIRRPGLATKPRSHEGQNRSLFVSSCLRGRSESAQTLCRPQNASTVGVSASTKSMPARYCGPICGGISNDAQAIVALNRIRPASSGSVIRTR